MKKLQCLLVLLPKYAEAECHEEEAVVERASEQRTSGRFTTRAYWAHDIAERETGGTCSTLEGADNVSCKH
jgi:hypothetical protein